MFCKLDVRRKSIVTSALSWDNRKTVVRYFVNRAAVLLAHGRPTHHPSVSVARRLYILCWREFSRRRLLPAVSPAAGHLTTPTVAGLPGLCENFRPTTSTTSPILRLLSSHWATSVVRTRVVGVANVGYSLRRLCSLQHWIYDLVGCDRRWFGAECALHPGAWEQELDRRSAGLWTATRNQAGHDRRRVRPAASAHLSQPSSRSARSSSAFYLPSSTTLVPSVLWRCWLGGRKGIRPEWWGTGVVICQERGADLHMAQLMPLPVTVSCFSKTQLVLPFWYRLTRVSPRKGPLNGCVSAENLELATRRCCFGCSFVVVQ